MSDTHSGLDSEDDYDSLEEEEEEDDDDDLMDDEQDDSSRALGHKMSKHFFENCYRYASNNNFDQLAKELNEHHSASPINYHNPITMECQVAVCEDVRRYLKSEGYRIKRLKRQELTEITEAELEAELEQVDPIIRQEEADVRKLSKSLGSRHLSEQLLDLEIFQDMARQLSNDNNAWVSEASLIEFTGVLIDWTRRLVNDVLTFERELRWSKLDLSKSRYTSLKAVRAAIEYNGGVGAPEGSDQEEQVEEEEENVDE